jgi:OOP family OmpA-OmpF porin
MTMVDKKTLYALLLCAAGAPLTAGAATESTAMHSGFQYGLGLGQGSLHLTVPGEPGSSTLNGFSYTAFVGYRIVRYAAVEAAYLDGGSVSNGDPAASFKTDPHIATVTGLGILPIDETFSLFARAGIAHWFYNAKFSVEGVGSASFSETSNQLIWGAGASAFVDRGQLRFEYGQTKTSPNFGGVVFDARLRVISLSVVWLVGK